MALTYDDTTTASLPGGIVIDKSKFLNYYNLRGLKRYYYSFILNSNLGKLNSKYPKDRVVQKWINLNEHFLYGCANPSIIINKSRGIYASYTDLTNDGGESTPVIKIIQLNNSSFKNLELNDNDKTVSVAMYFRKIEDVNARAWSDFEPLLPELFSVDKIACKMLQKKIKTPAWECLKIGLLQIENAEIPGLYHLKISNDLTHNAY
jgi:hypothetical protein